MRSLITLNNYTFILALTFSVAVFSQGWVKQTVGTQSDLHTVFLLIISLVIQQDSLE